MNKEQKVLLDMVKSIISEKEWERSDFDTESLLKFAQIHGLSHVPGMVVDDELLNSVTYKYVLITSNQIKATEIILNSCEKEGIYVVPLKGVCTVKRYNNQDLRTMGDVDILYKSEQNEKLKKVMFSLGYEWRGESQKHDHYVKKPYMDVEMHRELVKAGSLFDKYYGNIWEKCKPESGKKYVYTLSVEDEFIFNIIHLTEHFLDGGIGIRLIMDIYVYNHIEMNKDYVRSELKKLGLLEFYCNVTLLAEKWFGNEEISDEIVDKLEKYVLESGLYGSAENIGSVNVSESKFKYVINSMFPSLKKMKTAYLWLDKYPFLLPVAWIMRIIRFIFKRKATFNEQVQILKDGNSEKGKEIKKFFKECGL